jgi:hypothetical protein
MKKVIKKIIEWHSLRNLLEGSTDQAQFVKLMEEISEVYASIRPNVPAPQLAGELRGIITDLEYKNKIKSDDGSGLADGIGDVNVVLINIAERNGLSLEDCLKASYKEIKDRKGLSKNGIYVKYEDLTDEEKARFK